MITFDRDPICEICDFRLSMTEIVRAARDGVHPVRCDNCLVEYEVDDESYDRLLDGAF